MQIFIAEKSRTFFDVEGVFQAEKLLNILIIVLNLKNYLPTNLSFNYSLEFSIRK